MAFISSTTRLGKFQRWLRVDPSHKPKICSQIYHSAEMSSLNYWLEIVFSAGIATFGLVLNSPAVIIGAMLISPLMGPIMATGLSLAAGDLYLAIKAVGNLVLSISLAVGLSAFFVWLLPFHSVTGEILARTNPNLLDLGVALFSGLAGSFAVSRSGGTGGVTTLPGVAIAVALMPPLCTMGFGLGSGANMRIMGGAGLLFLTNLVAIVTSAFAVFLLIGMNTPEIRLQLEESRKHEPLALVLSNGPLARAFSDGGQLRWRILMLVILLGSIAIPLRTALMQVAGEAVARGAAQEVVRNLLPREALVSQAVDVGRENVTVRLISTATVPQDKVRDAEKEIERRTGRRAEVQLSSIASRSELAELMQRLAAPVVQPAPPSPVQKTLDEIYKDLLARVTPIINAAWPADAPLKDFEIVFGDAGIVLNVHYESAQPLGAIPIEILSRELQEKLATPNLSLNAQRLTPPRPQKRKNRPR